MKLTNNDTRNNSQQQGISRKKVDSNTQVDGNTLLNGDTQVGSNTQVDGNTLVDGDTLVTEGDVEAVVPIAFRAKPEKLSEILGKNVPTFEKGFAATIPNETINNMLCEVLVIFLLLTSPLIWGILKKSNVLLVTTLPVVDSLFKNLEDVF